MVDPFAEVSACLVECGTNAACPEINLDCISKMALAALEMKQPFPQGSLSEAIVINEDVQGCAKRKMFSFIIPDVNDTDKTVL